MATRSTPLIKDAVAAYLDDRLDTLAPRSYEAERNLLARFVRFCPDKQVGRLNADDFTAFLKALKRGDPKAGGWKGYGNNSLNITHSRLRSFVGWCARKGYCRGDLMDGVQPLKADARKDYLRLTVNELLTMLESAKHPRDRAILAAGMNTGLRSNELTGLRVGHFDLDQGEFYVSITKSRTSDVMPITSDFDAELRSWFEFYRQECGPLDPKWFAFPALTRPLFISQDATSKQTIIPDRRFREPRHMVRVALERLGYSEESMRGEGFHTLRRSVARLYFDSIRDEGYDYALRETQALLHHVSAVTTELYLGLNVERARRDVRMKGKPFLTGMVDQQPTKLREAR